MISSERTPAMDCIKHDIHSLSWLITAALGSPKKITPPLKAEVEYFYCPSSVVQGLHTAKHSWTKIRGEGQITCGSWGVDVQCRTLHGDVGPQLRWQRLIWGLLNLIREAFNALHITVLTQDEHTDALLVQSGQHLLYSLSQVWVRQVKESEWVEASGSMQWQHKWKINASHTWN